MEKNMKNLKKLIVLNNDFKILFRMFSMHLKVFNCKSIKDKIFITRKKVFYVPRKN